MTISNFDRAHVQDGIYLLDDICQDWRKEVNWANIDMSHHLNCLLGFIFGTFEDGCTEIQTELTNQNGEWTEFVASDYGFDIPNSDITYDELKSLWIKELAA